MLKLPNVTLCCVETRHHSLALRAIARSRNAIRYAHTLLLTRAFPSTMRSPNDVEVVPIPEIASHADYSKFILKELAGYIETPHVLLIQWDGYVINPDAWREAFLAYDYLGAPWPNGDGTFSVGNGGFSLRSKRLLMALADPAFPIVSDAEDVTICGIYRGKLESRHRIKFAPYSVAREFSFELDASAVLSGQRPFGFHGIFNLIHVEPENEILTLVTDLPYSVAAGEMTELLFKNLLICRLYRAAIALGTRMLQAKPDRLDIANALVAARAELALRIPDATASSRLGAAMNVLRKALAR